jgi:hypothetical protein
MHHQVLLGEINKKWPILAAEMRKWATTKAQAKRLFSALPSQQQSGVKRPP